MMRTIISATVLVVVGVAGLVFLSEEDWPHVWPVVNFVLLIMVLVRLDASNEQFRILCARLNAIHQRVGGEPWDDSSGKD